MSRSPADPQDGTTTTAEPADAEPADVVDVGTASAELLAGSMGEYARIWARRVRAGESGAPPVVVGLIAIVIFFWIRSSAFMTPGNLVNLMAQAAFIITLGMAEIFVLLLGDIDLAAGYTAACGAVVAP